MIKLLVDNGASLTALTSKGNTILHEAVASAHFDTINFILSLPHIDKLVNMPSTTSTLLSPSYLFGIFVVIVIVTNETKLPNRRSKTFGLANKPPGSRYSKKGKGD